MACIIWTRIDVTRFLGRHILRFLSYDSALDVQQTPEARFRTIENDPMNHRASHEGRYYTVPTAVQKQLYLYGGLTKYFTKQAGTFGETCIMVRKPALEIMNYMRNADYSKPVIKYILYGEPGSGKSMTLAHLLHYGLNSGHLIIHVPWVANWIKRCKGVASSTTDKGFFDMPLDAAEWLVHFKCQNLHILNNANLTISNEYIWSKRESTPKGAPLLELVDLGINRVKYATDIVLSLVKEIKTLSTAGRCKTLVVIDGFNAFVYNKSTIKAEDKSKVLPLQLTLTKAFLELTKFDWCNGSIVVTVDRIILLKEEAESDLPLYLLGKQGFEHLDPFVPVFVPKYNDKEFHSCIDYYCDRHWLQHEKANTEEGRKELQILSASNPYDLMIKCNSL